MGTQTFIDRVYAEVKERKLKIGEVQSAADITGVHGTSRDLFKLVKKGESPPRRPLVEAYAHVLGLDPWAFNEWRMLAIRDAVDPQPGQLDQALANLKAIESGATNQEIAEMIGSAIRPAGDGDPDASSEALRTLAGLASKRRATAPPKTRRVLGARKDSVR